MLSGHFLGDLTIGVGALVGLLTVAFVFFINIHLPVLGFNTLLSGHFLGDLVGLFSVAFVFFIDIHLPVLGFNTLLSGHFLGDLTIGLTGDLTIGLTGDLTIGLAGDLTIGLAGDLTAFAPLFSINIEGFFENSFQSISFLCAFNNFIKRGLGFLDKNHQSILPGFAVNMFIAFGLVDK